MEISWFGAYSLRLRGRTASVITDPPPSDSGYKLPRSTSADIISLTHEYPDRDTAVSAVQNPTRIVSGPGEYEVSGISIEALSTHQNINQETGEQKNVSYLIEIDEIMICHLGAIANVPQAELVEELSRTDVLLIPTGGGETLDMNGVTDTIALLQPRLVVPMNFKTPASNQGLEPIDRLITQMGLSDIEPQPRLNVTPTNMPLDTRVVILQPRS
jgi:L-ascorbate metabolism protein UlaG (beta-lactamase superfamily)